MSEEILKSIFGDDETLDLKTIQERIEKNGVKLADLSKGNYVDKKKYDDEISSWNKKYSELDNEYQNFVNEVANDDTEEEKEYNEFMKQFDELKKSSQATAQELDLYKKKDIMRNNGIENKRFMDLALFELKDSQDFENDIKTWVETNKELITPKTDTQTTKKGSTIPKMNGNPDTEDKDDTAFTKGMLKGAGLKAEDLKQK